MSQEMYTNTSTLANIVSIVAAVHQNIAGNELASLDSLSNTEALTALIAAKLQQRMAPVLARGLKND